MTIKELQDKARSYLKGELDPDSFRDNILDYLTYEATTDDYVAFATWLNESKTEH